MPHATLVASRAAALVWMLTGLLWADHTAHAAPGAAKAPTPSVPSGTKRDNKQSPSGAAGARADAKEAAGWRPLFDGKSLDRWKATSFGPEGPVRVKNGQIVIEAGDPLTGITWAGGKLPTSHYEVEVEAMRVSGGDFFCALTVPVGKAAITLVVGGWGGSLVGLSNLDDQDASENETRRKLAFTDKRWYRIRLRVEPDRLHAWIDDVQVIGVLTKGRKVSIRPEVEESRPLGIATYRTTAAVRAIKLRELGARAAP